MFRSLVAAAAAAFLCSGAAAAATLTFTGSTTGVTGRTAYIWELPSTGKALGNIRATGFNMTDNGGSLGSFVAWCLDIIPSLRATADYQVTTTPFSHFAVPTDRIQAVFDANYGSVDATDLVQAAAFQLALWEALYDTDWSLTNSTAAAEFRAVGNVAEGKEINFRDPQSQAINAAAAGYLAAASSYSGSRLWNVTYLEATGTPRSQSLVTVSPIPLPATALLLLTALGGAAAVWRRRAA